METYKVIELSNGMRCRWVYDYEYETVGSYAYDTEEQTRQAEQDEIDAINNGDLIPLGCIIEQFVDCCPHCDRLDEWIEKDSCFGIVMPTDDNDELKIYARHMCGM